MKQTEQLNPCFPNQTISDELLQNMTYDDMILTIYHCQRGCFNLDSDEKVRSVSHQLLRILLRITNIWNIDLVELTDDVLREEQRDN